VKRILPLIAVLALALTGLASTPSVRAGAVRPNVILIVTDDQAWNTLWAMPVVQSRLVAKGTTFPNAFAPTSVCCPSRATILTGEYAHTHGVWSNQPPLGGFHRFDDSSTLATWLRDAGYRTGLVGKYMNGYEAEDASYVPPGWDRWTALIHDAHGSYLDFDVSEGGRLAHNDRDYVTDFLRDEATEFIRASAKPFFLYFAPTAPHMDSIPAPRHERAFSNLQRFRPPSFNERDISDKPAWVADANPLSVERIKVLDQLRIDMYETLLAVDEAVGALLKATQGEPTMLLFTSDNGFEYGEHRLRGKNDAYDHTSRIPLVVREDGVVPAGAIDRRIALNVDLAQTIGSATGVSTPRAEGLALFGLETRSEFVVEGVERGRRPAYCGVRTLSHLFVHYATGEEELYSYGDDPFELTNLASSPDSQQDVRLLRRTARSLCQPLPPGLPPF
jgi:N-acetylglucosamine-6-sulfatase